MDAQRFDRLTKLVSGGFPRRRLFRAALSAVGIAAVSRPRRVSAHATLSACRPDVASLPNPRPHLSTPYRAMRTGESPGDAKTCGLAANPGIDPVVTGGYADASGSDTHTDHFYNEYYAVDFATKSGGSFPVLAAADGLLLRHDEPGEGSAEYANTLWIRHNASWQTKYMHLSDCGIHDTPALVRAGDQIGWSGQTGATSVHLHFELRGGDGDNFTSYPADPAGLRGQVDCCKNGNCNWSYPVLELGVPAPPSTSQDACSAPCLSARRNAVPGGIWLAPKAGASISSAPLHIEARAYRSAPRDPAIALVNFTAWWPGPELGPKSGSWKSLCTPTAPVHDDVYACDVDLANIGVPPGAVTISFDVYDHAGNRNLAPNGEHEIVWSPGLACPSGQLGCHGQCVDPKTNGGHCGQCDNGCGIFQICCDGVCACDTTTIIPFYCMGATVLCVNNEPQPA